MQGLDDRVQVQGFVQRDAARRLRQPTDKLDGRHSA